MNLHIYSIYQYLLPVYILVIPLVLKFSASSLFLLHSLRPLLVFLLFTAAEGNWAMM